MKKLIIIICIVGTGYYSKAQNPPVVEKAAPKSNPALPSGGTLGSNSGVNPAGNPGTIVSFSGNSNSINTKLQPSPNVEPGVFLSSSPEGTVVNTTVTNGSSVQRSTTATSSNGAAVTTTIPEAKPVVVTEPKLAPPPKPNPPVATNTSTPPAAPIATPGKTALMDRGNAVPAYSPVLSNYIPAETIKKINAKYGSAVYDIKTVKIVQNNKIAYLVRLSENGKFRNELYYDEP